MPDDPISPSPPPSSSRSASEPPSRRRPLAWIAVGVVALGSAGGGAAAVALADGAPDRLAVAAAAEGETTPDGSAESGTAEGPADEDGCAAGDHGGRWGHHHRPGAHGTVTGVDGTTVTVEDDEGEPTTVTTDDETTVLDVAEGELADVAEGDAVVVLGETGEEEAVTARRVVDLGSVDPDALHPDHPGRADRPADPDEDGGGSDDGDRPDHPFRPAVGTVASVDGDTFTVTTDDGDVVVTATDETEVTAVTEIAVSDLAEGDAIAARGEADEDGTVAAEVIVRGELDAGRPGSGGPGFGPGGPGFGPGGPGRHGGPGGWSAHDGERPEGAPDGPEDPADEGTTTTTEA